MNNISDKIYEGEPKEPKSIQIELSELEIKRGEELNEKIFKMLLEIFYDGMKLFHMKDNQVNLDELSDTEFYKIKQYFWSVGFEIFYIVKLDGEIIRNTDDKDRKSDLKDYYLDLKTKTYTYTIFFDYY
jgi:hypothetical protein